MKSAHLVLVIAVAAAISFAASFTAAAQTPAATPPVLPPGPLIAKNAPNFSTWTVTTVPVSAASGQNNSPGADSGSDSKKNNLGGQVMQVVKTGDIRFVSVISGGVEIDRWCKGLIQITKRPEWPDLLVSSGENRTDPVRLDFSGGDFAGFDWLSPQNFVGVRKVDGRDCLVFKDQVQTEKIVIARVFYGPGGKLATPVMKAPPKVLGVACVDLESRLPVALTTGADVSTYKFGEPPTAMLTLPPDFQAAWDKYNANMQLTLRRASRP